MLREARKQESIDRKVGRFESLLRNEAIKSWAGRRPMQRRYCRQKRRTFWGSRGENLIKWKLSRLPLEGRKRSCEAETVGWKPFRIFPRELALAGKLVYPLVEDKILASRLIGRNWIKYWSICLLCIEKYVASKWNYRRLRSAFNKSFTCVSLQKHVCALWHDIAVDIASFISYRGIDRLKMLFHR